MDAHEPGRPERLPPIDGAGQVDDDGSITWPTVELDLTGRDAAQPEAEIGGGHRIRRRNRLRRGRRSSLRRTMPAIAVLLGAIGLVAVSIDSVDEPGPDAANDAPRTVERDLSPPPPTGVGDETTAGPTDPPIAAREVATLAIGDQVSGSNRTLALVDSDGLRIADLDAGTITDSTALGPVGAPILVAPGQHAFVYVSRDELREVDARGRQRIIGAAHGAAVGIERDLVWMLARSADRNVLTAVRRSSGDVAEQIVLDAGDALVGFHHGRPLVAAADVVLRHESAGATVVVASGRVVALGGHQLLVRRCGASPCDEAVVVDLDDGSERSVVLDGGVRAFGLGEALSPDGRWLVGLVFGQQERPEVAIHPLVESGVPRPEPLVLSLGALGFGGRAAGVTWSPDAALLAAPGSSRVALVDVERRSTLTIPIRLSGSGPTVRWLAS